MQNFNLLIRDLYWLFSSIFVASLAFPSPPVHLISLGVITILAIIYSYFCTPTFNIKNGLFLSFLFGYFVTNTISHFLYDNEPLFDSKLIRISYLFIIPFIIQLGPSVRKKDIKALLKFAHSSIFIFCSLGIVKVFWLYKLGLVSKVFYSSYAEVLGFHSTTISLFVTLAYIHVLFTLLRAHQKKYLGLALFLQVFYLLVLYLLAVRISLIAIGAVTFMAFVLGFTKWASWRKLILLLIVPFSLLILGLSFLNSTYTFKRFSEVDRSDISTISDLENRKILWSCGFEVFANSGKWLLGNGLRVSQNQLNYCYIQKENLSAAEQNYSVHNQYIQSLVDTGILGFSFFMLFFGYLIYLTVKNGDFLITGFLIVFLFFFMTESIFNRAYGVFLFSFISGLFIKYFSQKKLHV